MHESNNSVHPNGAFRDHLVAADQRAMELYDTTVVALSGGALGVSALFMEHLKQSHDVVCAWCLPSAWTAWAISLALCLLSHFTSHKALRLAIVQHDDDPGNRSLGGGWGKITQSLNACAGLLFLLGLAFMVSFVWLNIEGFTHGK